MANVVLESLVKAYPDKSGTEVRAVNSISLEVADREFMVLVGPSGCGKSTTLRMIAGLEEITSGTISIDGKVVNQVLPKDSDIAMVFQNYAIYPHMSVYENMAFGLKLRKMPKAEIDARVREAAAVLGLADYLDRKPKALSGGQRQRVALGRAIVRKPKVFLFDEPLSNLDAKMRVSTRAEISKLRTRLGATMIYVTHDQVEAMTMGDRICVMKDGDILQVDTPLALYESPKNLFVAGFIGSPSMNFLKGRCEDGRTFVADSLRLTLPEALARKLKGRAAEPLILGLRPEHLRDARTSPASGETLTATIEVSEPMGAETYLHLKAGPASLVARVDPGLRYSPGETVTLSAHLAKAHLFDPASEQAL